MYSIRFMAKRPNITKSVRSWVESLKFASLTEVDLWLMGPGKEVRRMHLRIVELR